MSEPKSRRIPKPIWFGVAAVLMVVLWVYLSVWLPSHREQIAIREIEKLGGVGFYEGGVPEWLWDGPKWMQEIAEKSWEEGWFSWSLRVKQIYFNQSGYIQKSKRMHDIRLMSYLTPDINDAQLSVLIQKLVPLRHLWKLNLNGTSITDEGLRDIGQLHSLTHLDLDGTKIIDAGLEHVGQCHNLESLSLWITDISDDGLENLYGLSKLRSLHVEDTRVTEAGVEKLQKALPACKIIHKPYPTFPFPPSVFPP